MYHDPILTINSGSSSLKVGVFVQKDGDESALCEALVDGLGQPSAKLEVRDSTGKVVHTAELSNTGHDDALPQVNDWLINTMKIEPVAVGHRVVHGGPALTSHQLITPQLLEELRRVVHFAPLHIPTALALIDATQEIYPKVAEYACFDTAFHRTLPEAAARFALPDALFHEGVRRYGFHGLSYESIIHALGTNLPDRTVIAHLGNGASLAAISKGVSIDTSMGLTPTGGIPSGTRSGDLDPGVVLFFLQNRHMRPKQVEDLLNHQSGLLGLSGRTSDMRDLEASAAGGDANARLAIDVFARSIKKTIGAYAAVLGGLNLLVFTGGIGEHSALVRASVCAELAFLGIRLNAQQNQRNAVTISDDESECQVRVVRSEEDRQMARHCRTMMTAANKALFTA
jgi:acetate kinase